MTAFIKELLTHIFVLAVLLCAFAMIYAMGCAAVIKTTIFDDWSSAWG